jgi:arylsulfatase A-like enzyme
VTGRFGFSTGVVNHGGRRAEPFPAGPERARQSQMASGSWPSLLQSVGLWCASISTFGQRHSAYHWYAGFNEVFNLGTDGIETADQVTAVAVDWLERNGTRDNWFLHVHLWDPHTPYRTPSGYGNPLKGQPAPMWIDQETIRAHRELAGPHSAQEVSGWGNRPWGAAYPRQPDEILSTCDVQRMFDGYDVGIHYADHCLGRVLEILDRLKIATDTAIIVSSDHGENLGELGIYCDHQTADEYTHRVPLIVCWPGVPGGRIDRSLRYQFDVTATVADLLGAEVPASWDGISFAPSLRQGDDEGGRDHLILSSAAWATQRSVRFGKWLYIRTYHDAFHDFPEQMLFDLELDPAQADNLAEANQSIASEAAGLLAQWEFDRLGASSSGVDPISTVLEEGGGYYARGRLDAYLHRLQATGREQRARTIAAKHCRTM